ncbi:MAG TPA: hypothetical protein VMV35_05895, partial [Halothiobacillus sp.]|nr:hypothetical protein [Halothiobacillus sp.]
CIAVFIPMSYGIGGFTCLVPRDKVIPLPDLTPQQALRFAMAGGVGGGKAIRDKLATGTEASREAATSHSDPGQ